MAKFKKFIALALASAMCATTVAMAVACGDDEKNPGGDLPITPGKPTRPQFDPEPGIPVDRNDGKTYTYRLAANSLPTTWNTHTYQSNDATLYVLNYTEDALYGFDYNDAKDGYKIVPSMASAMPQDVTSQYVGNTWGIASTDSWKAIRVTLRHDLKYDNGDPITAQCFVDSMQLLLNPNAKNYRADSYYGKQFSIVGAEKYVKAKGYNYSAMVSANFGAEEYFDIKDLVAGEDGVLQYNGKDIAINPSSGGNWGSNGLAAYYGAGYFEVEGFDELLAAADENGYVKLTQSYLDMVLNAIAQLQGCDNVEAYAAACEEAGKFVGENEDINYAYAEWQEMCFFGFIWEDYSFSDVGIKAVDDYTLDFILEKPLQGFYLNYNLCSSMSLVHVPTYEACMSESQGVYTNDYGTSKAKYVGFGPYKISSFTADSEVTFERNTHWFGYGDEAYKDQYQTTNISIKQVKEASTRLQMFLAGNLDSYGLQKDDMDDYQSSDWTYYTEGDSTWFVALNPDIAGLTTAQEAATPSQGFNSVNKTVLTLKSFRQAMSFAIDRAAYELALDPTGSPAKALFGNMIISDPDSGTAYRTTDEAKKVIVDFWGLSDDIGEGKEYATIDEAIASITGYDPAGAKELFKQAYDEAVEKGMIDTTKNWEVQVVIGQPGNGGVAYYNDGYEFLKKAWTDAVKGTPFENHITFTQSQPLGSSNFAAALQNNQVDVLFGVGWTGSALDPYNLMEAYVAPNYQYDPGWDTTSDFIDVTIPADADAAIAGKTLRASVYAWGKDCLQGTPISAKIVVNGEETKDSVSISAGTEQVASVRLAVLAAVEGAVLENYSMIPVGTEASASLKGKRIRFCTEEYIYGVGRGGVAYLTYKMDDAQWAAYVSENNGSVDYK